MDKKNALFLSRLPLGELMALADRTREREKGAQLDLCTIMNAKSGMCGEDCKFCAQSRRHACGVEVYGLKNKKEMFEAARRAQDIGSGRFGIVTSGNTLTKDEVLRISDAVSKIKKDVGIKICGSLGRLDEKSLGLLKEAGLSRYHHNIETSPAYYPKIVTTHTFEERLGMIRAARRAGLEVCSGGIIGMGESWADRIEMALLLKELDVVSVPVNILVPIKGTPLESKKELSCVDAIKTIAIFRIILKDKTIKIAAGRESILKDFQAMAFMAGANGMLIGGYLTVRGRDVEADRRLVREIKKAWKR